MFKARLSVLLPIFRPNEDWLTKALKSLKTQTYTEWVLVVSLDGSDGDTIRGGQVAIEILGKDRVRLIQGDRSGITGTLNRGLRHCETEYIARMDADDICLPNRFFDQVQTMDKERELVACGTQIIRVSENGEVIESRQGKYPETHCSTLLIGATFNTPIAHPTVMIRTWAAKAVGGYRDVRCMEDYDLFSRLAQLGEVRNIPCTGLLYRVHERQHSQTVRPSRSDLLRTRLRFTRELASLSKLSFSLMLVPVMLWVIGPQGEMFIRRCCRRAVDMMGSIRS